MSIPSKLSARAWLLIPLCAVGFLVWTNLERAQRAEQVTNTDREEAVVDAASPTGYAGGKRWLIVPEHNNRSYQWISETQQMLAHGQWRVRHLEYENAPFGREVHAASPYRWWLGVIAWGDHTISGRPLGLSVECAALWADPLLHLLFLVGTTLFVWRQFGAFPAVLLSVGVVTLFPFSGGFLPGAPDDRGLAQFLALWSLLPLLAAPAGDSSLVDAAVIRQGRRRMFFLAGIVGGLGLWVSVATEVPVLVGLALGGIVATWIASGGTKGKGSAADELLPWRTWALAGAATSLAAYLVEYFPDHLDLRLQVNHPLYGLAWLGTGELLTLSEAWFQQEKKSFWTRRRTIGLVLAVTIVATLPVALTLNGGPAWIAGDLASSRLTGLPNGAVAGNFFQWLSRDGLTASVSATCVPLLLVGLAAWQLTRRRTEAAQRARCALAFGPVVLALALACTQLAWWNTLDGLLLALLVAATTECRPLAKPSRHRWLWSALAGLACLPGVVQLLPMATGVNSEFTRLEVEGLIERSLAHWVADHAEAGEAVVLTPPDRTTSWCFHGGLRGLATANWENQEGVRAAVRIASATTAEEALARLQERRVTHIILPSWDVDLDELARLSQGRLEDTFLGAIRKWSLPPWLRAVPYQLPSVAGFEQQSVVILAVTDENNRAASASRLAEYFLESKQPELAASAGQVLQRFPADLGAMVALAQVEKARGDREAYARVFAALVSNLTGGFDRALAWDRRVSLAIVLAQGERNDLAREQVRRCLEKLDERRIRSLTTASLYRLQVLGKAYGLPIADPHLQELAGRLLPAELRRRL